MLDIATLMTELLSASLSDFITPGAMCVAFVACALSLLVYALVPSAQERAVRHLPSPPRTLPFLDHTMAPFRYREKLYDFFLDESIKHNGAMWRYKAVGRAVAVVLTTPEAFEHVLKTKFEDFGKERRMWRIMEDLLGNGIFAVNGPLWMHQRKTASHLFSLQMMRDSMEQSVVTSTTLLCRRLAQCAADNEVVDVKRLLNLFTMDVFTKIGFGVDLKSLEASETHSSPPFAGAFDRASAQILRRFRTPVWVWQLKKWLNVGSERTMREDNKVVNALVYEVISRSMVRRTTRKTAAVSKAPEDKEQQQQQSATLTTTDGRDLVSLFLEKEAAEYDMHGEKATTDAKLIRDMAVSFLIAGRDTTSQSMAWFLIMLNRNPRVTHKIRAELAKKLPGLLDGSKHVPSMEDVHHLTYLEAAIRENLRLNPVVAITTREALRDTTLHDGTFVKQGTRISLPVYALSRLEQVWGEDALEFKPERWIDEETAKLIHVSPFKFSAFLGGPRICIGMKFALMEMKMTMAALLGKFDLKTVKDPFDFTYKPTVTMTVNGPVDVTQLLQSRATVVGTAGHPVCGVEHARGADQGQWVARRRPLGAALKIQRLFRCRNARKHLYELLATMFEKFYDDDSGLYYYYNNKTGETTWEKPKVLKQNEDIALSAIYAQENNNAVSTEPTEQSKIGVESPAENDGTKLLDVEQEDELQPETSESQGGDGENQGDEEGDGEEELQDDDSLGFTLQERELVQQQFDHYDTDHSGSISAKELLKLLSSLGEQLTLQNVQDMIQEVDKNSNGEVEFKEFLMILKKQKSKNQYTASLELPILFGPKELENLKRQFIQLDLDGSGFIDEHEIQALVKKLGKKVADYDLKAMLLEVDEDGSGTVGFNEFLKIITPMMKDKDGLKRSDFAALLDLSIALGLLNELGDVMKLPQAKLYEWWNADMIAEQKRLEAKRERRRKQEEERRRQLEKDQQVYRERQAQLDAIEAARRAKADGLVHEVLFPGDGLNYPNVSQYARVHYVGMFEKNNEVFESTRKRGGALEFCVGVGNIIKGFDLVLQKMSVGETAKVTMAPMLAYGIKGRPPKIPPNTTLVFKIELISVKEKLNLARDFGGDGEDDG